MQVLDFNNQNFTDFLVSIINADFSFNITSFKAKSKQSLVITLSDGMTRFNFIVSDNEQLDFIMNKVSQDIVQYTSSMDLFNNHLCKEIVRVLDSENSIIKYEYSTNDFEIIKTDSHSIKNINLFDLSEKFNRNASLFHAL